MKYNSSDKILELRYKLEKVFTDEKIEVSYYSSCFQVTCSTGKYKVTEKIMFSTVERATENVLKGIKESMHRQLEEDILSDYFSKNKSSKENIIVLKYLEKDVYVLSPEDYLDFMEGNLKIIKDNKNE